MNINFENHQDLQSLYQDCYLQRLYSSVIQNDREAKNNIFLKQQSTKLVTVKRIDKVHPTISGNKFYKLKYNLQHAKQQGFTQILSFGGAYSNHIHALAHACNEFGFDSVGMIRGNELANKPLNKTLATVKKLGMDLHFITREEYRNKSDPDFIAALKNRFPHAYVIPEGGTNKLAMLGTQEIITDYDRNNFDVICCAVGTGGTIAGIIKSATKNQLVLGFSALKSNYQIDLIEDLTSTQSLNKIGDIDAQITPLERLHTCAQWAVFQDQEFGGYGRYDDTLINFIGNSAKEWDLPLEPIYTAKALFKLCKLLTNTAYISEYLAKKRILFIHTGGLQGYE